ncbi:MAG: hypothetical protein GX845_00295 [Erysipelothrix sp.]|jgi:methylase of polypeptide subunit release factors|nr:hypothetical protein [Erysipelothrix sp.]
MRHTNINVITHQWLLDVLTPKSVVVDATMGNGHDTLFLSEHAHRVYAFDINPQAYANTKHKVQHQTNVILILDGHENMLHHIKEPLDGVVFNCGYLPGGDRSSTTKQGTTIQALMHAKTLLKHDGWLCITVYTGHPHGKQEAHAVYNWLQDHVHIKKQYTYPGVLNAPIAYFATLKK